MTQILTETESITIERIAEKVFEGEPLTFEEGVWLFRYPRLPEIAALANAVRVRIHPNRIVTYVVGVSSTIPTYAGCDASSVPSIACQAVRRVTRSPCRRFSIRFRSWWTKAGWRC